MQQIRGASAAPIDKNSWRPILLPLGVIMLSVVAAYSNSFGGPFVFDDLPSIPHNPTIRQLWPIWAPLSPPQGGATVSGRPVLNLSLAVNYAMSGSDVKSYHATNLAMHTLAAILLFGLVRRTLLLPALPDRWRNAATSVALAVALLWAVHPLQTESVTYVVQRAELLVGLFYLLTLYCFVRGATSSSAIWWYVAAALACLLGMASKEVMVSAPLIVLLYDRTFVAGSFREAWRRRRSFYLILASTWLLLGWLVVSTGNRGGSAGFSTGISWWAYLCTQFGAIVHYLGLAVWPHPLLFDYGTGTAHKAGEIVPYAIAVALLASVTVIALWRWPKAGFLGVWFFVILAPSSSVVPVATQTIAEHRMYLPLAAVVAAAVIAGYLLGARLLAERFGADRWIAYGALALIAATFGGLTFLRNYDYRSALAIWEDTARKAPDNGRVHVNFGNTLVESGRIDEAIAEYSKAPRIGLEDAHAQSNLGAAFTARGQYREAIVHYQEALRIDPNFYMAHNNLGFALAELGRLDEAAVHYRRALEIKPDYAEAHNNLGLVLEWRGEIDEAAAHFQTAVEIMPQYDLARQNLVRAMGERDKLHRYLAARRELLRSRPDDAALLNDIAWMLATNPNASVRRGAEAIELARRAVQRSKSEEPAFLDTLAAAYAETGRFPEAVDAAQRAASQAAARGHAVLADAIRARQTLYQAGSPYREIPPVAGSGPQRP